VGAHIRAAKAPNSVVSGSDAVGQLSLLHKTVCSATVTSQALLATGPGWAVWGRCTGDECVIGLSDRVSLGQASF